MPRRIRKRKEKAPQRPKRSTQSDFMREEKSLASPERAAQLFSTPSLSPLITPPDVLSLQRLIGNQAVQRLLLQQKEEQSPTSENGGQNRLTLNTPNDRYEQQAEDVASQVVGQINAAQSAVGQRQEGQPERFLRRSADAGHTVHPAISERVDAAKGGGQPLSSDVRNPMEQAFDADFGSVRVHTDSEADEMNQSLQSHAFTTGQDIFFQDGKYAPDNQPGQELLAHELAHTMQPDAHTRIAPWAPTGHRMVTEKAFLDGDLAKKYGEKVRQILIDRAPDMDYIQDQQHDMNQGITESKENISAYKKKAKKFTNTKSDTEAKQIKAELDQMWINNTLHRRDTNYMRMHGEGGQYIMNANDAAALNRAVTVALLQKAVEVYSAGNMQVGIELLGDALHQAEDRGSHFEGAAGKGHDARQTISMKQRLMSHKGAWKGVPKIPYIKKPRPDNSDVNKDGAQKAIGYAQDVLYHFAAQVGGFIRTPEEAPTTRHVSIKGIETYSKGKGTKRAESLVGSLKTGDYLSTLGPQTGEDREGLAGVNVTPEAKEALEYFLKGQKKQKEADMYRAAKQKFSTFGKAWRKAAKEERHGKCVDYYNEQIDPLKKEAQAIAFAIKEAFSGAFETTLNAEPDYESSETGNVDEFISAYGRFLDLKGDDEMEKTEKIKECEAYYKLKIMPFHETLEVIDRAIRRAYKDKYGGNLF